MIKTLFVLFALSLSAHSIAQNCEIKINDENWGVRLEESQEKRLIRILTKKGYTIVDDIKENTLELKLDISYKRGSLRGEIADSKSSAKILKGKEVIASNEKEYCALMNESYIDLEYGMGDIVLFGATKEGAHRRLIKSVKNLPACDELAI
ncbi:MAG: hypothetical protein ACOVP4_07090 [Bacteriovoracaceae bacterium]